METTNIQETAVTSLNRSKIWWISLAMIAAGVAAGIYAQFVGHHHAFGNTRQMPWGMLIGVYAYFAVISTGLCLLSVFSHVYGGNRMGAVGNRAVWLSIIMLFGAFMVIGLEIESPWRMPLGVLLYPNFTSNIWWMGTLYGIAVSIMIIEMLLILLRWYKTAIFLGILCALAEASANSNLGAVFASLKAHPFWHGAQIPIFFLGSAILSGAAAMVVMTSLSYRVQHRKMSENVQSAMKTGGKLMVLMCLLSIIAIAWKLINSYCGSQEMIMAADSMTRGPLMYNFWGGEIAIGLVVPVILLVITHLRSVGVMAFSGILVLIGQFFSRYDMVVAGQIVPWNYGIVGAPANLPYIPTVSEYLLVVAGFGVVGAGFIFGEKFLDKTFMAEDSAH